LGKPASLHATTGLLASNVYAGQHPKPQHWVPPPKETPTQGVGRLKQRKAAYLLGK